MNLIERFGYDAASKMSMSEIGLKKDMEKLQQDLLEYRRQHNIFEAGDLIFDFSDDDIKYTGQLLRVGEIGLDFLVCYDNQGKRFCVIINDAIHATPEEIQAGRRL